MHTSDIVFVTFGDSWTLGHGTQYVPGMSEKEYTQALDIKDHEYDLGFRGQISNQFGMSNINFSSLGSSNQRQFRLAREFFTSTTFKQLQDEGKKFLVFWALTTTARNEFFLLEHGQYISFRYNYLDTHKYKNHPLPKAFIAYSYDHLNEVNILSQEIKFWNSWFKMSGIKNFWTDTFEHNTYSVDTQVENFILDRTAPRDLYSNLLRFNNLPVSNVPWKENTELVKLGILNPYSKHPTKLGQKQLAELINPYINQALSH